MRTWKILLAAPLLVGVAGCAEDGYYVGVHSAYYDPYPYYGWYDGYYGPIYDGYWGSDGFFYYRRGDHDRHFYRGDHDHFRRGDAHPGGNYRPMQGTFTPQHGQRMPHYPGRGHH